MAAPTIRSYSGIYSAANTSSKTVPLPATILENDVLVIYVYATNRTVNTPSGWSVLTSGNSYGVFYKTASGTEDGSNVTVTLSSANYALARTFAVGGASAIPAISTVSTADLNPPSLTSGFGAIPTLWLACAGRTAIQFTGGPSGYSGYETTNDPAGMSISTAYKSATAATEDPGAFSHNGSSSFDRAFVIAFGEVQSGLNNLFFGSNF